MDLKKDDEEWYAEYMSTTGLTRASICVEPTTAATRYYTNKYKTKQEATDAFLHGLEYHVDEIIDKTKNLCNNKILKKRLQKYGGNKALEKLRLIEKTMDNLKNLCV